MLLLVRRKYFYQHIRTIIQSRMNSTEEKLNFADGSFIGYKKRTACEHQNKPGIIFCSGFLSSLNGTKACFLDKYCEKNDLSYVRFDYMGHQFSSGSMNDFTMSLWKQNTVDVLDHLTQGPQLLVGSSIGGWLSLLAAIERPGRIHSLLSIANGADFMHRRYQDVSSEEKVTAEKQGYYELKSEYEVEARISLTCLDDLKKNLVLDSVHIPIKCPVRLLHGMNDSTIPYQTSVNIAEKLDSDDVSVHLFKNADHRFSKAENLEIISDMLDELLHIDHLKSK